MLTGYGPFDRFTVNPSHAALLRAGELGLFEALPMRVEVVRLPVEFERAARVAQDAFERFQPAAAVSFGVHFGGPTQYRDGVFYAERIARNRDGAPGSIRRDAAGVVRDGTPIVAGGPPERIATLPTGDVIEALHRAGFPAEPSDDAGDFLCNHIFYAGMHQLGARIPYGFVHVPPSTDQGGTITLDRLAEGLVVIARVACNAAGQLADPSSG